MRLTAAAAAVLGWVAAAAAVGVDPTVGFNAVFTPEADEKVQAGRPFVVRWSSPAPYADGDVYIQLLGGPSPSALEVRTERLTTLSNSQDEYTWDVDASLGGDEYYGLRFVWAQDDNVVQYSQRFHIVGAADADAVASGSSTMLVTSSQGVKTMTLSSADSVAAAAATTTTTTATTQEAVASAVRNATAARNATVAGNATVARNATTAAPTTVAPSGSVVTTTPGSRATADTVPSPSPSSGAVRAAGSVAAIGGLVAALLAM